MNRYKTPLRYPGGKQKLAPFMAELIEANNLTGGHYVEAYAGGAGVAIDLLLNDRVSHIHLNDSCKRIYAFWRSVLTHTEDICRKISRASLTVREWRRQREIFRQPANFGQTELGFSAFYLNRCNRSGIFGGGLIGGLSQDSEWNMDARFNRNDLIRRIEAIALRRKRISVRNWDAERFLADYLPELPTDALVYLDPPYFRKADRLYLNHYGPEDHQRLSRVIQRSLKHSWVVTYDAAPEILSCYAKRRRITYNLAYSAAAAYAGREVAFFSDDLAVPRISRVAWLTDPLKRISVSKPASRRRRARLEA